MEFRKLTLSFETLKSIFDCYCSDLRKTVKSKMFDNNTCKAFSKSAHRRHLLLAGHHHRLSFLSMFTSDFDFAKETIEQAGNKYISISLESIERSGRLQSWLDSTRMVIPP